MDKSMKHETYISQIQWTGNRGTGTSSYRGYDRTWDVAVPGKPVIPCSNDPLLGGDPTLMNPEDLLLSSLAACHMLWYLHLASEAGVTVLEYTDRPVGTGQVSADGSGNFVEATLHPAIRITADSDLETAHKIHGEIHRYCFIARSVNFPVHCEPEISQV